MDSTKWDSRPESGIETAPLPGAGARSDLPGFRSLRSHSPEPTKAS
ncbi:hypothetical protein B8V81_4931 [Paenibacillus pasadenensis]|uniref:Uncharacterized protein n=1 Tax=Paenibacillus pasadenensis TaxID=217090 RepID=A0A2N5N871_9BACL|nr:hypothetical protein B8V81_4931 [Paenibacillus pasadenensis]